ncbi:hypothetical protein XccvBFoX1_gp29 [Xanthomonas phage FoX1]|uniref:Uncharacterized protein n=1 Tax=Xanthomonas phage FoX1 TaxID=2723897 RepID=A0A858NNV3_9CAUD|nr:hypothetical protein KNU93_gp29 [Xanthomonas phage FoX1]QJB21768.1 hypothetical protein XccvBFoX1_gp29 [Xanthomonas phage FoX1]
MSTGDGRKHPAGLARNGQYGSAYCRSVEMHSQQRVTTGDTVVHFTGCALGFAGEVCTFAPQGSIPWWSTICTCRLNVGRTPQQRRSQSAMQRGKSERRLW